MKKILLDTNAYSRFMAGDTNIMNALTEAETVFMSIFVLGELYAGFKGGSKEHQKENCLTNFFTNLLSRYSMLLRKQQTFSGC